MKPDEDEEGDVRRIQARRLLCMQYYARLAPRHVLFRWPPSAILIDIQNELLEDLQLKKSGEEPYRRSFLKELLKRLEDEVDKRRDEEVEVNGELLEAYTLLLTIGGQSSSSAPSNQSVVRYFPAFQTPPFSSHKNANALFPSWAAVVTQEDGSTITRGTTGLKTWEASFCLAAYLVSHQDLLQAYEAATIIELGCGSGFLSIVAANSIKASKATYVLTDLDGEVLQRAEEAMEKSDVPDNVNMSIHPLDWKDVQGEDEYACRFIDQLDANLILAADIVFDPELIPALCSTIDRLLRRRDTNRPTAYIASTVRNPTTFASFRNRIEQIGLHVEELNCNRPIVNLQNLELLSPEADDGSLFCAQIPLFPATHDQTSDGQVVLLRITTST